MRLDHGSRLALARDRTDRFRAEADAERLAGAHRDRSVGGWEGRPASSSASERVLAQVARVSRGDPSPCPE
jgi:hypothetical protein